MSGKRSSSIHIQPDLTSRTRNTVLQAEKTKLIFVLVNAYVGHSDIKILVAHDRVVAV